jgi:glycosyltransferase involved in cell wall biosynthesis
MDMETIEYTVINLPQFHFVFVGGGIPKRTSLHMRGNVTFTGPVMFDNLPAIVQAFDVAIIPYVCSERMKSVYPNKINEYLASGKPVVSTNFGDLDEFRDVIHIADTKEEFLVCIERALRENTPELISKRQALARANSWEVRAKTIADIIEENITRANRFRV